jgi:hypothetical protein
MFSNARRIAIAGVYLYLSGVSWHLPAVACAQHQSAEQVQEKPKVGGAYEGGPPEQLPLPRELQSETILPYEPYFFQPPTRINRYEVWQFYEVGRFGQFRPRVIYSAYGTFYLYDGRPFPWVSTHQRDFIPRLISP